MGTGISSLPRGIVKAPPLEGRTSSVDVRSLGNFASRIVTTVGRPDFPDNLIESLVDVIEFDLFCFTAFPNHGEPLLLHHNLLDYTTEGVLSEYCSGGYTLDPLYGACRTGVVDGVYFFSDGEQQSRLSMSDDALHPCVSMNANSLAGEAAYIMHLPSFSIMCSLMRSPSLPGFNDEEIARMASFEPIVRSSLSRQFSYLSPISTGLPNLTEKEFAAKLSQFGGGILSARERSIVGLILRGHTSHSIAYILDISEGTVKNHRKNIYRKMRIESQAGLFHRFFRSTPH